MHRYYVALVLVSVVQLSCAERPRSAVAVASSPLSNPARPAEPRRVFTPESPREPWNVAYTRACRGSITLPIASTDDRWLVYCDAVFEAERGEYRGAARLGVDAFLGDSRVIARNYSTGGLDWGATLIHEPEPANHAAGAFVVELATNFDRSRVVDIEHSDGNSYRAVVRHAPGFAEGCVVAVPPQDYARPGHVGFFGDGRVVIRVGSALSALTSCKLQPLGPPFENLSQFAISEDGERAALTWHDGTRAVVATRTGALLHPLPQATNAVELDAPMALDATGQRVAYVSKDQLTIAELDAAPRALYTEDATNVHALRFTRSSRALLVDTADIVRVIREGEPVHAQPVPDYTVTPPAGFVAADRREGVVSFDGFESEEMSVPPGFIAGYRKLESGVDVMITATDASEFGTRERPLDDWAASIIEREGDTPEPKSKRIWATPDGRFLEYAYFQREGCDPHDRYVRFVERGPLLYRIALQFAPGAAYSRVKPLLAHFFDGPTGEPTQARSILKSAPIGEPC